MLRTVVSIRLLPVAILALSGAAAWVVLPSTAGACLPLAPCASTARTVPPAGSVDVPLNVELEAIALGAMAGAPPAVVTLRRADTGEDVPLIAARTPGRFRSALPLAPGTLYELSAPMYFLRTLYSPTSTCDATPTVVASFTTGTTVDTMPPTNIAASGGGCGVEECDSSACCGPYRARLYGARWSATDDGTLPIAYAFGSPDGPRTLATSGSQITYESGSGVSPFWVPIPGASPVYAIDAAGNVSLDSAAFTLTCSTPPPAPPIVPPPPEPLVPPGTCDGGACPPPPAMGSPGDGCSVSPRASSYAPLCALLCTALFTVGRRRRMKWLHPFATLRATAPPPVVESAGASSCSAGRRRR